MPRGECKFPVMEGQGFGISKDKEQGLAQKPDIKRDLRGASLKELEDEIETKGLDGMVWKSGGTETYGGGVNRYAERGTNRKKWKNESPENKEAMRRRKDVSEVRQAITFENSQTPVETPKPTEIPKAADIPKPTGSTGKAPATASEAIKAPKSGLKRALKIGLPIAAAGAVGGYLLHKRNSQSEVKELGDSIEVKGAPRVIARHVIETGVGTGLGAAGGAATGALNAKEGESKKEAIRGAKRGALIGGGLGVIGMPGTALLGGGIAGLTGKKEEVKTKGGKIPFGASPQTTNPGETYENMPSMSSASAPMTSGGSSANTNTAYAQGASNSPTMLASEEPRTITKGRGSAKFAVGDKIKEKAAYGQLGAADGSGIISDGNLGSSNPKADAEVRQERLATKGVVSDVLEHAKPLVNLADDVVQVGVRKAKNAFDDPGKKGFADDDSMIVNKKNIKEKGLLPARSVIRSGIGAATRGALPGAGVGAVTGALGDGEDRLGGAARGAVVGGTLGAVVPAGMAMAQRRRNNAAIKAGASAVRSATGVDKDAAKKALRKTLADSKNNIPVDTAQMMGGSAGGLGGSYRGQDENQFKGIDSIEEKGVIRNVAKIGGGAVVGGMAGGVIGHKIGEKKGEKKGRKSGWIDGSTDTFQYVDDLYKQGKVPEHFNAEGGYEEKGVITDAAKAVGKKIKNLGVKEEVKRVASPKKKAGYAPMVNPPNLADDPIRIELGNRKLGAYDKPLVLEPNYKGYKGKIVDKDAKVNRYMTAYEKVVDAVIPEAKKIATRQRLEKRIMKNNLRDVKNRGIEEKSIGSHLLAAGGGAILGGMAVGRSGKESGASGSSRDEIDYALGKDRLSSTKSGKPQLKKVEMKPIREKK
jgi:hypothetical protein